MVRLNVGCHLSGFQDIAETAEAIRALGGDCVQVFLSPPIGKPSAAKYRQLQTMREAYHTLFRTERIRMFVHAPYTLNFAKSPNGPEKPYWIDALVRELEMASFIGAEGVVLHVGKALSLSTAEAEENMMRGLTQVLERTPNAPTLLLETAAGQGTEIFVDPLELARFGARLRTLFPRRVGLCVDTCHVFAAGHTLGATPLDALHRICPIALFHVNDSKKPRGSKVDRHEALGKGYVPKGELGETIRWALAHDIACVLETPNDANGYRQEIQWMRTQAA